MTHGKFVIEVAVYPRTAEDREKIAQAIASISRTESELQVSTDPHSDRIIVAAMNELDLQSIIAAVNM
jgi:elongation factor G